MSEASSGYKKESHRWQSCQGIQLAEDFHDCGAIQHGTDYSTAMEMKLRQAIILCAGSGKRLGSISGPLPKAMLPVAGRPLIERIVAKMLGEAGYLRIVIVVGAQGDPFRQLFRGERRVRFAVQPSPKGTADALLAAAEFLDPRFLVTYGDLWVGSSDYRQLREAADKTESQLIAVNKTEVPGGAAAYLNRQNIVKVVEKPVWQGRPDTRWNASGLYVFNQRFLDHCRNLQESSRQELELTAAIQRAIDHHELFRSYKMSRPQIDIGVPERYHGLCATLHVSSTASRNDPAVHPEVRSHLQM